MLQNIALEIAAGFPERSWSIFEFIFTKKRILRLFDKIEEISHNDASICVVFRWGFRLTKFYTRTISDFY